MEFSTAIDGFNSEFNLNAINEYNKYLQGQASFSFDAEATDFERALQNASKSAPLKDKSDRSGCDGRNHTLSMRRGF